MTITRLLFVPGLATPYQTGRSVCSVGLVLDDKRVAWGDCVCSAQTTPPAADYARESIEKVVSPAVVGSNLVGFRELAGTIESLTETVTKEESIQAPAEDDQPDGISRRDLLTGRLRAESPPPSPPPTRLITSEQPLHTALRYGLSQALLKAVALDRGVSIAEVIAREYNLPHPAAVVPLHAQLDTNRPLESLPPPSPHIAALGYTAPAGDPAEILGENGVILQRFLRILKQKVMVMPGWNTPPRIHIDLRGGLGKLYGNNTGQMLGALVGLETSVRPFSLRIENPVGGDSLAEIIAKTGELREFLDFRRMDVPLAVGPVENNNDTEALSNGKAVDMLRIEPVQVGDLSTVIEMVLLAKKAGKQVMLDMDANTSGHAVQVFSQAALAMQPDIVAAPTIGHSSIYDLHLEMQKDVREAEFRRG